jgi:hypothetical protein
MASRAKNLASKDKKPGGKGEILVNVFKNRDDLFYISYLVFIS